MDNPELGGRFFNNLPQVEAASNTALDIELTVDELHTALMSLANEKAPGIDGLPVEFYKSFWPVLGEDMLEVFQDSLNRGQLPLSCRRAVITLLPKKGDLQLLKNWRPVSLLCGDYKILSKALALRLREVVGEVIHVDQTYCVPGRSISDNITLIRHVLDVSSSLGVDTGLISVDQEKAFDRVEHQYLWQALAAFGFNPGFIAKIQVLYRDIASILKVNGGLAAPFNVERGVRQGCSLSGMLYSIAIEPLLHKLRRELNGVVFNGCPAVFKLSAYADDVILMVNTQKDIDIIKANVGLFNEMSSAKINWSKSDAVMVSDKPTTKLVLPGGLTWKTGGIKYLGVFLGDETVLNKNWDNVLEKIEGRLRRWSWLLPCMSYRGRALIINNLVSSSLWHRLACVDPPPNLLSKIQVMLVNFFWDKLHWIPQAVLYLPKDEGGQGLVHLASRGAAFRLQFIQRLLYGPKDLVWRPLAHMVLQRFAGLGLKDSLFLMDLSTADLRTLPLFYRGAFTVWKLMEREKNTASFHWLLQEPVVFGGQLSAPFWAGTALRDIFCQTRVTTLGSVVHLAGAELQDAAALAAGVGVRSVRSIGRLLEHWRSCLNGHQRLLLSRHSQGFIAPCTDDPFPSVTVRPVFKDYAGSFLNSQHCTLSLQEATGKALYRVMVTCLNRVDTPWRGHLQLGDEVTPAWRSLYKGPLTKKMADLQWRVLHSIVAVNSFLSIISPGHTDRCVFCGERETVFHCYSECTRLIPLFALLKSLFRAAGEEFSVQVFILGFKYRKAAESKCKLLNFILGQAKMAVHVSRKRKEEDMVDVDVSLLFCRMVKARVHIDFKYYSQMQDMDQFIKTWTHSNALCSITDNTLVFSHHLI